jgi:hypothetical protein
MPQQKTRRLGWAQQDLKKVETFVPAVANGREIPAISATHGDAQRPSISASAPEDGSPGLPDPPTGVEAVPTAAPPDADRAEKPATCATESHPRSAHHSTSPDPSAFPRTDAVEVALADALSLAARAGRFDVVAQLAKELEARRQTRPGNVLPFPRARGHREGT